MEKERREQAKWKKNGSVRDEAKKGLIVQKLHLIFGLQLVTCITKTVKFFQTQCLLGSLREQPKVSRETFEDSKAYYFYFREGYWRQTRTNLILYKLEREKAQAYIHKSLTILIFNVDTFICAHNTTDELTCPRPHVYTNESYSCELIQLFD